jgi:hypothetical protein
MKKLICISLLSFVLGMQVLHAQYVGVSDVIITPRSPLHVHLSNSAGSVLQMTNTSSGNASSSAGLGFTVSTSDWTLQNYQNGALAFGTNGTQRLLISNTGTLQVNNLASGASGAIIRSNSSGLLSVTNFSGLAGDVLLGTGAFGPAVTSATAWQLTGNTAINPLSNWLGTNDAQPLCLRTNNAERARILSTGNVLFNRTTALFATDLIEGQGNATFPDAINGYTDQATGTAVFGGHSDPSGVAIAGLNSAATGAGTGVGVYGESGQTGSGGVWGNGTTLTRGIIGTNNNANYAAIQAQNNNAAGDGLYAVNGAANGAGVGDAIYAYSGQTGASTIIAGLQSISYYSLAAISGSTDAAIAGGKGLIAACDNATGTGVQGQSLGINGTGVFGSCGAAAGANSGVGVYGQTTQGGGPAAGVYGLNNHINGSAIIAINSAAANTGSGEGLYAQTSQSGAGGISGNNTHTNGTGILGAGNGAVAGYLVAGSGGAFTGVATGVLAKNTSLGVSQAIYTDNGGTICRVNYWSGATQYKILGTGTVSTVVKNTAGQTVAMHCPETPEIYFQDYGEGTLVNGKAHIEIDPTFARNIAVDKDHPLRVFVQLKGDCKGVYTTNETQNGFDVIELQGGTSNTSFHWTIVANRADEVMDNGRVSKNADVRFEIVASPEQQSSAAPKQALQEKKPDVSQKKAVDLKLVDPEGKIRKK